jgi:hypothetical protein
MPLSRITSWTGTCCAQTEGKRQKTSTAILEIKECTWNQYTEYALSQAAFATVEKKGVPIVSLDISPKIEARIIAKAQEAGLSIDDCLEHVVGENEQFEAAVRKLEVSAGRLSPEEAKAKMDRGLAQIERGEYVDGERFMTELLSSIDDAEHTRRTG